MTFKKNHVVFVILATLIFACHVNTDAIPNNEQSQNTSQVNSTSSANAQSGIISSMFSLFSNMFSTQPIARTSVCNCSCGVKNHIGFKNEVVNSVRIVGGQETEPHEYPWMVQLSYFGAFFCGGSLVNDRFVLTAAHCTNRWFKSMIRVTLGSHNRCRRNSLTWSSYVSYVKTPSFILHPLLGQDIALLKLEDPAPLGVFIRPICLPQTNTLDYTGYRAVIAGWGSKAENDRSQCLLRSATVPIMSNSQCFGESEYKEIAEYFETDKMMCAGYSSGGVDSCQGDSGGPLVVQRDDGRYEAVGIVSWGMGCARPKYPGVYTRITKQLDWIRENINEGCFCRD